MSINVPRPPVQEELNHPRQVISDKNAHFQIARIQRLYSKMPMKVPNPDPDVPIAMASHRHASTHNCPKAAPAEVKISKSKQLAAQAIAQVKASSSSAQKSTSAPQNSAKSAKLRQIELMKMRRKAEPANPRDGTDLPMEERIYVKVIFESKEKILWVKNDIICGKALDLFAAKLGVHISPLQILSHDGNVLKTDETLATQIENPSDLTIERKSS
ncbi:hypothetical protein FRC17_003848 [Serendipita sp. 399]|nr:hypothetical protein FRC17_003848 [Serendipita sp. 399]